jgi:hypothetical protein
MQYMLIMNTPRDGYTQFMKWPKTTLDANVAFMQAFSQKLHETGELVITAGLAAPDRAKKVRAGKDGKPITDGVFPESKEFLAGWWVVEVDSEARAGDCGGGSHGAGHVDPQLGRHDDRPPLGRSARGARQPPEHEMTSLPPSISSPQS